MELERLACSSSAYIDSSLITAIGRIARIRYRNIEAHAGHIRPYLYTSQPNANVLRRTLRKYGVDIVNISIHEESFRAHYYEREIPSPYDDTWSNIDFLSHIKEAVLLAQTLGSRSVSIAPRRVVPGAATDIDSTSIAKSLSEIASFARETGIVVSVSYGPGLLIGNAGDAGALLSRCPGLTLELHVANSHLACETPCNIAKEYRNYISHIKIADIGYGERPYLLPGAGEIEWISFFRTLRKINYSGYVSVDLSSYRDIPDLAATRTYFYLSNIINGLRSTRLEKPA